MSFSYISNLLFIFILVFLLSCQNSKISNNNVSSVNDIKVNYEENENLDLSLYEFYEKNIIDYYTNQSVTIDFLDEDINLPIFLCPNNCLTYPLLIFLIVLLV